MSIVGSKTSVSGALLSLLRFKQPLGWHCAPGALPAPAWLVSAGGEGDGVVAFRGVTLKVRWNPTTNPCPLQTPLQMLINSNPA